MKLVIAGFIAASALAVAMPASLVPAAAQGIYIGPGIGVGADPYDGRGGYDGYGYHDQPTYQGRSAYRDRANRGRAYRNAPADDDYDQYGDDRGDLDGF